MGGQSLQKLKAFTINRVRRMEKRQISFLEELEKSKNENDFLSVKEIVKQYSISRKTFDRLREKGLKVNQPKRNGKILVKRKDLEQFISSKTESYGR